METLNLSVSMQESPVDLSTNRSIRTPIAFGSTMVVPNPVHYSDPSKFQNNEHFPHLRFHSSIHSPSETDIAQKQCHKSDICDINSARRIVCDSTEQVRSSVQNYEHPPKMDGVPDKRFSCSKNENYGTNSSGSSKKSNIVPNYPEDSVRCAQKRKYQDESVNESKTIRKRQRLVNNTDAVRPPYNNYPYDYLYNYIRRSSDHISSGVDQFHAGLYPPLDSNMSASTQLLSAQPGSQETESLLAAVQHSQMLYYSYCNQLFQNLQNKRHTQSGVKNLKKNVEITLATARKTMDKTNIKKPIIHTESLEHKSTSSAAFERISSTSPSYPLGDQQTSEVDSSTCSGRRRAPRALTGKHVRPGTGASLSTLLSLREKIAKKRKDDDTEEAIQNNLSKMVEKSPSPSIGCRKR